MISRITFPTDGTGYVYTKPTEPADIKCCREYFNADKEERRRLVKENKKEIREYEKTKDTYINSAYEYLAGKTFEFCQDKVNVIFGPNGSGKSTVINALAGTALTKDGWSTITEPFLFPGACVIDNIGYDINKLLKSFRKNDCDVDWDGSPVYFHNFKNKINNSHGWLGELTGSALDNEMEEMHYMIDKGKWNAGKHMLIMLNKIMQKFEKRVKMSEILAPRKEMLRKGANDIWERCFKVQFDYLESFPESEGGSPNTLLFDEIDENLDVLNTALLFKKALPAFVERQKVQVILVSHSPIVLMDDIYNSEKYNIVSLNQEYTDECRKLLNLNIL